MASLWYKLRRNIVKNRYSLRRLGVGSIFFLLMYAVTRWVNVPLCVFYNLFGISCPACGLSRGMLAVLAGDWAAATAYHVLSLPLSAGIAAYYLLVVVDTVSGTHLMQSVDRLLSRRWMYPLYGALLLLSAWQKYS